MPVRVPWRYSLRTRLVAWFGALVACLLVLGFSGIYGIARNRRIDEAHADTRYQALQAAQRLASSMRSVQITGEGVINLIRLLRPDRASLAQVQVAMLQADASAIGMLVVLKPGVLPDGLPMAWYAAREGSGGSNRDLVADGYDYAGRDWYGRTLAATSPWWSEPYRNETAGGTWVVTLNLPLRDAGGTALGMVSLDVPVSLFSQQMEPLRQPGQRPMLITPGGTLAVHPDPGVALNNNVPSLIAAGHRTDLRALEAARKAGERYEGLHTLASGETRFSVLEPVGGTGWYVHLALSHDVLLGRLRRTFVLLMLGALGATLALTLVVMRLAGRIAVPLAELSDSARHLARGDFDQPVPHGGRKDEVGVVARAMDQARDSIRRQLAEIEQMAIARQKLESELGIAREIQLAMLPADRSQESGGVRVEVAARLEAAKAVGGDFYHFFSRDAETLWFAIGDVSDKGVPAALFMARTMTVLEVAAHVSGSPDEMLRQAAQYLTEGNEACMFATVLCGVMYVPSGDVVLASAGHEAPLLLRADGRRELLPVPTAVPLGLGVDDHYPLARTRLEAGDTLLLYTDGVTEAFDGQHAAFGEERLLAALDPARDAAEQCRELLARVREFSGDGNQSDDITVLVLRRRQGPPP